MGQGVLRWGRKADEEEVEEEEDPCVPPAGYQVYLNARNVLFSMFPQVGEKPDQHTARKTG